MTPTFWNRVRLWWHCLTHFHCDMDVQSIEPEATGVWICCADCSYGRRDLPEALDEIIY